MSLGRKYKLGFLSTSLSSLVNPNFSVAWSEEEEEDDDDE